MHSLLKMYAFSLILRCETYASVSEGEFIRNYLEQALNGFSAIRTSCGYSDTISPTGKDSPLLQPCICNTTDPNEVLACRETELRCYFVILLFARFHCSGSFYASQDSLF